MLSLLFKHFPPAFDHEPPHDADARQEAHCRWRAQTLSKALKVILGAQVGFRSDNGSGNRCEDPKTAEVVLRRSGRTERPKPKALSHCWFEHRSRGCGIAEVTSASL